MAHSIPNLRVAGSNPAGVTILNNGLWEIWARPDSERNVRKTLLPQAAWKITLGMSAPPRPVTLCDLIAQHKLVWGYCCECYRERDMDPSALPLPGHFAVHEIGQRMVCSACCARRVVTKPELYPGGVDAMMQRP